MNIKEKINQGINIGKVHINGIFALSPMAGFSDYSYRKICKEYGVDYLVTEMVSIKGICYDNKNTIELLKMDKSESPIALQLFGSDPDIMKEAVKKIEHLTNDIIDINMGCPMPKIFNNGDGSAILDSPDKVYKVVNAAVLSTKKPVTVKIRSGIVNENAIEISKAIESAGAAAITVHPRTREQYYSGEAKYSVVEDVVNNVNIPVFLSGDVKDVDSAIKALNTGCDGIMIGRAARGNPFIFEDLKNYFLYNKPIIKRNIFEIKEVILKHAKYIVDIDGDLRKMRKQISFYMSNEYGAANFRREATKILTLEDLEKLLDNY